MLCWNSFSHPFIETLNLAGWFLFWVCRENKRKRSGNTTKVVVFLKTGMHYEGWWMVHWKTRVSDNFHSVLKISHNQRIALGNFFMCCLLRWGVLIQRRHLFEGSWRLLNFSQIVTRWILICLCDILVKFACDNNLIYIIAQPAELHS